MQSKTIFKYLSLLTAIIAIILLFFTPKVGGVLLFAGIWVHPRTSSLLQKLNLYFYDHTIWIGYFVLILISILVFFIKPVEKENIHKHKVSNEWVYDEDTGLEYKKCKECGEVAEKRVPNLEYSDLPPEVEEKKDEEETEKEENIDEETEETEEYTIGDTEENNNENDTNDDNTSRTIEEWIEED